MEKEIGDKIDVLTVTPGPVKSNMNYQHEFATDPLYFANACLNKLGYESETDGPWEHAFFNWMLSF